MANEQDQYDTSLRLLIEAVVNDEASAQQHAELEQRLLDDQQARDAYLAYINLHASLNRWFLAAGTTQPPADDLVDLPLMMSREGLAESRPRRSMVGWVGLFAAACLLLIVGVTQLPRRHWLVETAAADMPTIVELSGDGIEIHSSGGQVIKAFDRRTIQLGETVRCGDDGDRVVLRYVDGTEVVLLGTSVLSFTESLTHGKQLHLKRGMLQADVAAQPANKPLLIVTPQSRVRVLGTRFELATDQYDGTRLDLESGEVELVRGGEQPVKVEPNSIAIVPTTSDPIRVSPRPAVVDTPVRETSFKGLKSVSFAEDGKTLIAGTRWQAMYWYEDDRLEIVPFSNRGREGINLRHQLNSLMVYFDQKHDQLVVWDAESRQPRSAFENIGPLKKQFRDWEERPSSWNPTSKVATMSPNGEWLAFQSAREFRIWRDGQDRWAKYPRDYDGRFVSALASSPDGQTLAVAIRRGKVDLVDVTTGEVSTSWSIQHKVPFAITFSADGTRLAVGLAGHVSVHDATTGQTLAKFEQPGLPFLRVALSADGRFVAASSLGNRVWLWDTQGNELPLLDIGGQIRDLSFSPVGSRLAVLSRDSRLSVWEVQDIVQAPVDMETSSN